jgi:hypothetical protein
MSLLPSETDLDKNINQFLKCLDSFDPSDRPGCDYITVNQFVRKAADAVKQLQFELKRPLLEQLIAMVLNQEWDNAAKALKKNFRRWSTNDGTKKKKQSWLELCRLLSLTKKMMAWQRPLS